MIVRPAAAQDLDAVACIYHNVWHETHAAFMPEAEVSVRTLDFFGNRMRDLLPTTLVADAEAALVGFVAWRGATLGQIFVLPEARGSGAAHDLLAAAERAMRCEGVADAELHCVVGNERARRFYERCGWWVAGIVAEPAAGEAEVSFWRMCKRI